MLVKVTLHGLNWHGSTSVREILFPDILLAKKFGQSIKLLSVRTIHNTVNNT